MTIQIVKAFNPMDQQHVMWLKSLCQIQKTLEQNQSSPQEQEKAWLALKPLELLNKNPMKVKVTSSQLNDLPMIHFGVAMRYAEAVLDGKAWTPDTRSE